MFDIKTIKINATHETWTQRIKHYKNYLRTYRSTQIDTCPKKNNLSIAFHSDKQDKETLTENLKMHTKDIQTELLKNDSITKPCATQTIQLQKNTKQTQTITPKPSPKFKEIFKLSSASKTKPTTNQSVALTTTAQQTIASARFSRSMSFNNKILFSSKTTSTVLNTENKAVQCKRATEVKASNTDTNTRDSFAQVENDLPRDNNSLAEELQKRLPLPADEFGVFIYMLNEIGETVISQNQILKSNTEMIKQIIQISLLQHSKRMNNNTSAR